MMEVLVGRPIRVPRAVFSEDIRRGCTKEPPDGTHWDGRVTAFSGVGSRPFSIVLTVLDPDDDDDKLMQEELDEGATLRQVRDWCVLVTSTAPRKLCWQVSALE